MPDPLLGLPLRAFARAELEIRCTRCRDQRVTPVAALLADFRPDAPLVEVADRLRCPSCGARAVAALPGTRAEAA